MTQAQNNGYFGALAVLLLVGVGFDEVAHQIAIASGAYLAAVALLAFMFARHL